MKLNHLNFKGFLEYFTANEEGAKQSYPDFHEKFELLFNEIIKIGVNTDFKSAQKGAGVVLYLRATKYLYTAHNLALQGHTEESRILLRSILELIILAYLISIAPDIYSLWQECFDLRVNHTDKNGVVNIPAFKDKKYKVNTIIDNHKELLYKNPETAHLIRARGEFSEYYSHENLFNIVSRVESEEQKSEIYIGDGFDSKSGRMVKSIQITTRIAEDIKNLIINLVPDKSKTATPQSVKLQ